MDAYLDEALSAGVSDGTSVFIQSMLNYLATTFGPDARTKTKGFLKSSAAAMMIAGITGGGGGGGSVTSVATGLGLTGGPITTSGTVDLLLNSGGGLTKILGVGNNELGIATSGVTNSMLANDSVTVTAGAGLTGGGAIALGSSTSLSIGTAAVDNSMLVNDSITVTAGTALTGGGTIVLGGTATLNVDTTIVATTTNVLTMSNKTLTDPVIALGLTATGSVGNDFSGSSGLFKTSTGAVSLAGSTTVLTSKTFSIADMTTGSVPFIGASGLFTQDNAHLFWDSARARLGIGTTTPGFTGGLSDVPGCQLELESSTTHSLLLIESDASSSDAGILLVTTSLGQDAAFWLDESDSQKVKFSTSNGSGGMNNHSDRVTGTRMTLLQSGALGIGTTTPNSKFDVNGNMALGTYAGSTAAPSNGLIVSGDVGIGTSTFSGACNLEVRNANGNAVGGQIGIRNTLNTGQSEFNVFDSNGTFRLSLGFDNNSISGNPSNYYFTATSTDFLHQTNNGANVTCYRTDGSWTFNANAHAGQINTVATQHLVSIFKDITWPGDTTSSQFAVCGKTDPTKIMAIGMDTNSTNGFGFLQASRQGTGPQILALQPAGGNVIIGGTTLGSTPSMALLVIGSNSSDGAATYRNSSSTGYSNIRYEKSDGTFEGSIGFANASAGLTHLQSLMHLYSGGPDYVFADSTAVELRVGMTNGATYIEQNAGNSAAVSSSSRGRLRYNSTPQAFEISKNAGAYERVYSGNRADTSNMQITTTSPTSVVTLTPPATGNYIVRIYYRVVTGTTTVTLTLTYTDSSGAQTITPVNAVSTSVGSYATIAPIFINSTASAITVTATAGTANQLFVSADIQSV